MSSSTVTYRYLFVVFDLLSNFSGLASGVVAGEDCGDKARWARFISI